MFATTSLLFLANEALVPGALSSWVAIIPRNLKSEAEEFLRELMMIGSAMKMQISNLGEWLTAKISYQSFVFCLRR
jgi:hypothetical protein